MTAALRVLEYDLAVFRRTWRGGIVTTFLSPVLFLASMGFGLGRFVDASGNASGALAGVPYAAWLAPGLLAAQAMQTGGFAMTYPIMGRIVWDKTYHGMLATPLTVAGIVFGEVGWIGLRLLLASAVFLVVMALFGLVLAPTAILAIPAAILTGLAFAAPIAAFTPTQRNDQGFNAIFRFGLTPLFLFSGTFFPIEQLPAVIRPLAWLTPLWHGVDLVRQLTLGRVDPLLALVHVVVLVAFIAAGVGVALVTFRRALVK
ncbi:MAG TPA: ABC transporter permease [Candidatus Limnocylindrales bacterium]|nr:ABC transporter permease [Candidatus Limnocylindrales bacterium]